MLFSSSKLVLLPLLSLAIAPITIAAPLRSTVSEHSVQVAQMTQLYCMTYAPAGSIGLTVYDAPNGNVIGRLQDGITVAYNVGDRSGNWAEVTGPDGTTGWVETVFLGCESAGGDFSENSEEYYDQSYDSYSEEYYQESYSEEYYEETYEESEEFYSY